LNLVDLTGHI